MALMWTLTADPDDTERSQSKTLSSRLRKLQASDCSVNTGISRISTALCILLPLYVRVQSP